MDPCVLFLGALDFLLFFGISLLCFFHIALASWCAFIFFGGGLFSGFLLWLILGSLRGILGLLLLV